jgi:FixJ family two-component response regulator
MAEPTTRVAVVDDELSVRKALARLLSAASYEPLIYSSAREFIDSLRDGNPECLVVDIHMPSFSGLDLQKYLKRANRHIPTIVITAFDDTEIRAQCMASGAVAFLTKPLHGPTLLDAVRMAVATSSPGPGNAGTAGASKHAAR